MRSIPTWTECLVMAARVVAFVVVVAALAFLTYGCTRL